LTGKNIFNYEKVLKVSLLFVFLSSLVFYSCSSSKKTDINTDDPDRAYSVALSNYKKGDYEQAIEDFSYIKVRFSGSAVVDDAQYYLAMSHMKREEFILAAYEFENLVKNYPTSPLVKEGRYNLAMSYYSLSPEYYLDQTYTRYAIDAFQTFIELYPDDPLASQAESRILSLRNKLAQKEYASAELYMTMDDYKAAIVYYDHVLNDYFDSDLADDALAGKINALILRRRYDEARAEITRFEEKFASSPLRGRINTYKGRLP
jgi:outer membrane protein assembly factor BamD